MGALRAVVFPCFFILGTGFFGGQVWDYFRVLLSALWRHFVFVFVILPMSFPYAFSNKA